MLRVLVGTQNKGKQQEYRELLGDLPIDWCFPEDLGLADFTPDESGLTFDENARLKALGYAEAAGIPALADDSGLEVDALDGAPGVFSARYAGEGATDAERYQKLLQELADVPREKRSARFVCVVALAFPDGRVYTARGTVEGHIGFEPRGDQGFGYDPIFVLPDGRHLAELAADQKHAISHRGRAVETLRPTLFRVLGLNE
ncbi:MAG: XTP/dITP diphosphatase [Anaerolineae bacterium]